jgi:hypothetical protein
MHLFGWTPQNVRQWGSHYRDTRHEYTHIEKKEYQTKQAILTRALRTLYQKGLIRCGTSGMMDAISIYSAKQAEAMGIEPKQPLTDKELDEKIIPKGICAGHPAWTRRGAGYGSRHNRNIRTIALTKTGRAKAEQLNVKCGKQF